MREVVSDKESWNFPPGHEIAPGRTTLKSIGGGNRYEVYLVWDDRRFSVMVAKILRPDLVEEEHALRGLRREMEALEALSHPVLLRAFDAHIEGPHPHVVVEHLEGPTLRRLIKRNGALPLEQTLPLGLHVASVIHYMAEEGWVHLDLKPDNLVMGIPPRVIDLSLARTLERAKLLTDYIGTNAYMPPEQCNPHGDVGPPSDVWGLGATLYHAVSGRLPFRRPRSKADDAPLEDRFPQLEDEPRDWRVPVPGALAEAILACLEKDPARRPTAAELAGLLQPLVADLPARMVFGRRGPQRIA
jgi:eukaryotic-like serine/threonine-protein kinase